MFPTTVPARPPPSGLTSNFTNPQDHGKGFAAVAITFLSLAVFIVSLRVYTQLTLLKRIDIDDCKCFGSDGVGRLNRISGRRHGPSHCRSLDLLSTCSAIWSGYASLFLRLIQLLSIAISGLMLDRASSALIRSTKLNFPQYSIMGLENTFGMFL